MRVPLLPLLGRLSARQRAWLMGVLFLANLVVPDPLPFVDEVLMALVTLWLARRGQ
jgi:hypothetical protein